MSWFFFRFHAHTLSKHVPYFSLQAIADALPEADPEHLAAHIAVLAQLALRSPDAFELKSDVITAFLLKKVLMTGNEADPVGIYLLESVARY